MSPEEELEQINCRLTELENEYDALMNALEQLNIDIDFAKIILQIDELEVD
jgi:hypothetical protein